MVTQHEPAEPELGRGWKPPIRAPDECGAVEWYVWAGEGQTREGSGDDNTLPASETN